MSLLTLLPLLAAPGSALATETLALTGLDPVALCEGEELPGRADLVAGDGLYLYRFASEASRDVFLEDPLRYGIQWDGGCGRMGPLSGKGSPDRWLVHDGRIWIFASDGCREGFASAPERFVSAPVASPEPSAEALAEGTRWIERAVEACGGAEAIDAARLLTLRTTREVSGWTQLHELVLAMDGRLARLSDWTAPDPAQSFATLWVSAEACRVLEDGSARSIASPAAREDLVRHAHRQPLALLWGRAREGFRAVYLGPGTLTGGVDTERVRVELDGLATLLHLAPADGTPLGLGWRGRAGGGVTLDVEERFTGWRTEGGVRLPAGRAVRADGEELEGLSAPWTEVSLSPVLVDAAFRL